MKGAPTSGTSPGGADPAEPAELVSGLVEKILYRSEDSGYTVFQLSPAPSSAPITVVATCAALWVGETVRAEGHWGTHKRHGNQFQADRLTCLLPVQAAGIERYLASGLIKGIGEVMAKRLVKMFGDQTLEIIDKESARLEQVSGIGPKRRELIKRSWNEQRGVRDIMVFLQSHGVGTAHATRIYRQYGNDAIAVVNRNPYRLCNDIWGIGFKSADRIALSVGIPPQSEVRARAGLVYVLQTLAQEGHCYCPREDLVDEAGRLLDIPGEILQTALRAEVAEGTLVDERGDVFLAPLHRAETSVAAALGRLRQTPAPFEPIQTEKALAWAAERMRLTFARDQAEALALALSSKVSIITGGPGVGKTTIVRALVDVFQARRLHVVLTAPTGRAAKRLEEATRHDAMTVHRLLKFNPSTARFEHDAANPLAGDVFIVDETSMLDIALAQSLLNAIPPRAVLVWVGDVDQLPSVGPGNVLRDAIDSGVIPCTRLSTIFRQGERSWIVQNAHLVNQGHSFDVPPPGENGDFFFIQAEDPDAVIRTVRELFRERIPRKFHFDPHTEIQILTPMRRNVLGTENLNIILQDAINPSGPMLERFGRRYRAGDRVMQVRNNYDKDVYNGDIGILTEIDEENQEATVRFDGRAVKYDFSELDEVELAYACSIHKSQGSEFPAVIVVMTTQHFKLLQRNLLYTALTRGRKLVCFVGTRKAVQIAIHNDHVVHRRTRLRERLQDRR